VLEEVRTPHARPMDGPSGRDDLRELLLDLHDGPMQLLYAALLQLDLLQASLGGEGEPMHRAAQVQMLVERASVELRGVIDRDRDRTTQLPDLLSMLREVGAEHQFATQTRVRFVVREELPDPGVKAKNALYRVLQESLSNAYRHGRAEEVAVSVGMSEQDGSRQLWMSVEDDGCGFDPGGVVPHETGLAGMTERMRSAGGGMAVWSEPGSGTRVRVEVEVD